MNFIQKSIFFSFVLFFLSFSTKAEINVVTTIKPIHSLISNVMEGLGKPSLIIEGTNNPHNFVLKPSHAKLLEEADIVFWIGEDLEAFMEKPLKSLAGDAKKISFMELAAIEKLKFREENIFEHDDHDDHDEHDGHDDEHDGHDDEHDGHNHGEYNAHLWLDPSNAIEMVLEISHELSELDPENKDKYKANANKTIVGLDKLINDVNKSLSKDVKYKYIVFHDAYQYFEKRFDITSAGALTLNPDVLPGAQQIKDIQKLIKEKNIKCIFSEPQFNPKIIETLANDTNITTGIMDPLGAYLDKGIPMYNELIMNISDAVKQC